MSRIGKMPISIPEGCEVKFENSILTVKGKKGELSQDIDPEMKINIEDGTLTVERPTESKKHKSLHGLYRSLINNMMVGTSEGYVKKLELIGVGYRCSNQGQLLEMALGFSHPVVFLVPNEVKLSTLMEKGKAPTVILESHDIQLIGQVAARIQKIRKPEPYKGKGIRFEGQVIRRKEGKSAGKA